MKKIIVTLSLIVVFNCIATQVFAEKIPAKYDLRDYINIEVKNQYHTETCLNTAKSSAVETFIKIRQLQGEYKEYVLKKLI